MKIIKYCFLSILLFLSSCNQPYNSNNELYDSINNDSSLVENNSDSTSYNSDVINVPSTLLTHEITLTTKFNTYSFEIVDMDTITNYNIAETIYDKGEYEFPKCFEIYCDPEYKVKYEYGPVIEDLQLYLKFVDKTFEYESMKCYYEQLEFLYDVKYSFEKYYETYIKPIDLLDVNRIYNDYFSINDDGEVCVRIEWSSITNGWSNLYIPLVGYTMISIDMYYGGCEYVVEGYPCKIGEDFKFPNGHDLIDLETLTLYEDGIVENVTESMYLYLYYSGVYSSHALKYIANHQDDQYFDINFNYYDYYKLSYFDLVEVSTDIYKIETNTGAYYFQKIDKNSCYMIKIESKYPLFNDKSYEEIVSIMELLSGEKNVYTFSGVTIYLNEDKTFTIEYVYDDSIF